MIEVETAGAWSLAPIKIYLDRLEFKRIEDQLDLKEANAAYILVSDEDRVKLLTNTKDLVKVLKYHQTISPLWKGSIYSQSKGKTEPEYRIISYASQVGNFKRWFTPLADHLKRADADLILSHQPIDGKPRPFPHKLAAVRVKNSQDFILTRQEFLVPESTVVPEPEFEPTLIPKEYSDDFKFLFWAGILPLKQLNQIHEATLTHQRYKESIIRKGKPRIPTNCTEGLDRIQDTNDYTFGYIIHTKIPVLIKEK